MSLPFTPTTTCAIYRAGNAPPADPDVASVPCVLIPAFEQGREHGETEAAAVRYTTVLRVELGTDIRDDWAAFAGNTNADTVYIPDQAGIPYTVVFVERLDRGQASDHKRVYLNRRLPTWPVPAPCGSGGGGGGLPGGTTCAAAVQIALGSFTPVAQNWYWLDTTLGGTFAFLNCTGVTLDVDWSCSSGAFFVIPTGSCNSVTIATGPPATRVYLYFPDVATPTGLCTIVVTGTVVYTPGNCPACP